ncbi:alpha/beta fold hydrolase [Streptomyces sp. NBC_01538]|uniref:alpha/beta fold hydrolase n=1 Tax=Streptomyces sp. NBC_01538 TaxID=2903897 RepID=UPI00386CF0BE
MNMQVTAGARVASTVSADGTVISYRSQGSGPGLLVVPGALGVAADFDGLAAQLAHHFTVHVIDRRGRGGSGPQGDDYGVDAECADIEAVREVTGARNVFGHSFGGFLTLEAALRGGFDRVVVYEPGVSVDGSVPMGWAEECERLLDAGKPAEAFLAFIQGINPETTGKAPRRLLRLIIPLAIRKRERLQKYALLATTVREHRESAGRDNDFPKYAGITSSVLLMAGKGIENTGAGRATVRLHETLAGSELARFPKLDHFGPEKDPKAIAAATAAFCLEHLR